MYVGCSSHLILQALATLQLLRLAEFRGGEEFGSANWQDGEGGGWFQ